LNAQAIANLVNDFGFDGVDIDYEPANPNCQRMGGTVRCSSDANFISVIDQLRNVLPQGKALCALPHTDVEWCGLAPSSSLRSQAALDRRMERGGLRHGQVLQRSAHRCRHWYGSPLS
jgi:hypothetical protein